MAVEVLRRYAAAGKRDRSNDVDAKRRQKVPIMAMAGPEEQACVAEERAVGWVSFWWFDERWVAEMDRFGGKILGGEEVRICFFSQISWESKMSTN